MTLKQKLRHLLGAEPEEEEDEDTEIMWRSVDTWALDDDRADWILRVLADVGVNATRAGKRVQWHGEQLRAWLDWIGEPVLGAEHKWATSRDEYQGRQ